ncbi:MAG: phosphoribosylformylglycinamidine cyclo-ligase [Anaerolineae bacterium]|nr:phosphoribosylformylglycinamidine cyclo-ligase [Anaerolineae bacterium]
MSGKSAYEAAGVTIDAGNRAVDLMSAAVRSTYGPEVLLGIGAFGGLWDARRLQAMCSPVLVASTDGVGTKTAVSAAMDRYENLGRDIVNHCVNDILAQGAEPLLFLDYVAMPALNPDQVARLVSGAAVACREAGCALIGGETAEMPGVYCEGQMDLVGTIIGIVERDQIIDGSHIVAGDLLYGLPSSGLHTNGFSLVRRVFEEERWLRHEPELGTTLGEALTVPHRSYLPDYRILKGTVDIKGIAHITGGGFPDNLPRILPDGLGAVVRRQAWEVPPLFQLIEREGGVDHDEMYRVFNMGIGMVFVLSADDGSKAQELLPELVPIGEVIAKPNAQGPNVMRVILS